MADNALVQLRALDWLPASSPLLSAPLLDWLMEEDSMTQRFERHCQQVTVKVVQEGFIAAEEVGDDVALLPHESRYWLREILLCGDGEPWLAGRTIVPESTLNGPEQMLQQLGTSPLGRYLFASSTLTRDFIEPGKSGDLWGRRSLLRLSGKPLLLTELFLPPAPLYASLTGAGDSNMERSLPMSKFRAFSRLMRIDKPIGSLLLMWPTFWALWLAGMQMPPLNILMVFVLGVFFMRAAGCVVNDFADRKIDGHVKRTQSRPLPSGAVTSKEARLLFAGLVLVSFCLVLTMNTMTIWLSFGGLALAWVYPFMKRYTHLPQVVLGAAFGWAIPMGWAAVSETVPLTCWLLFRREYLLDGGL